MHIHGFTKTTLLDYPHHLAATIFTGGCNFRCPFCHNTSLIQNISEIPPYTEQEIFNYLSKRKGILEGVCITGGEPALQKDLKSFLYQIKELGFKIKLDTNGSAPDVLKDLLHENLLDYVALDIKNCLEHYNITIGTDNFSTRFIEESVSVLKNTSIPYEFRTTIVKELHTEEDILAIGAWLQGDSPYFLQNFEDSGDILSPGLSAHTADTLQHFKEILLPYLPNVHIRGL